MPAAAHAPLRIVQSRTNSRVKQLRAALLRAPEAQVGLEGFHLVEEALRSGLRLSTLFVRSGGESALDALPPRLLADVPEILSVAPEVFDSVVTTHSPQPLAALAQTPTFTVDQVLSTPRDPGGAPLLIVLAGVQDPGNVGAIVRSAEAFGATGMLTLPQTGSVWNPKSLRASMGSAFRLPAAAVDSVAAAAEALRRRGVRSLAAVAPLTIGAVPLRSCDLRGAVAFWIGSEGAGLSEQARQCADEQITIPCPGPVESLNAAVAAGVLLYEASRQRGAGDSAS